MRHSRRLRSLLRNASIGLAGLGIAATTIATSPVEPEPPIEWDAGVQVDGSTASWSRDFRLEGSAMAGETDVVVRLDMSEETLPEIDVGQLGLRIETTDPDASLTVTAADGSVMAPSEADGVAGAPERSAQSAIIGWETLVDRCDDSAISGTCSVEVTLHIVSAAPTTWTAQGFMGSTTSPYTEPAGIIRLTRVP